jgi:hypothetical protein
VLMENFCGFSAWSGGTAAINRRRPSKLRRPSYAPNDHKPESETIEPLHLDRLDAFIGDPAGHARHRTVLFHAETFDAAGGNFAANYVDAIWSKNECCISL